MIDIPENQIVDLYNNGTTFKELMNRFHVRYDTIRQAQRAIKRYESYFSH